MDNTTTNKVDEIRGGDLFLQLGAFGALYACVASILILLFRVINSAFPPINAGYSYYFNSEAISFQVATLIVFFPVYLIISSVIQKIFLNDPTRRESRIRRGLIYLTLFIAGFAMAGDLVTVIYSFLDGQDMTAGFILKALAVLVVFSGVFYYYLQDVRSKLTTSTRNILRIGSIVLIIGSIAWGFAVMGSPRTQRLQKYDQTRLSDLQNIQSQVTSHWQSKGMLPENIAAMQNSLSYYSLPKDPQTGKDYEYRKTGLNTFELCSTFSAEQPANSMAAYPYGKPQDNWTYNKGRTCFSRSIDLQLYPIYNSAYNVNQPITKPIPVVAPAQ